MTKNISRYFFKYHQLDISVEFIYLLTVYNSSSLVIMSSGQSVTGIRVDSFVFPFFVFLVDKYNPEDIFSILFKVGKMRTDHVRQLNVYFHKPLS